MRPSLIPHHFITKTIRKKYHKKRSQRTWQQFMHENSSYIGLCIGVLFILFILYIKYSDKRKKQTEFIQHINNEMTLKSQNPETQNQRSSYDGFTNGFLYY